MVFSLLRVMPAEMDSLPLGLPPLKLNMPFGLPLSALCGLMFPLLLARAPSNPAPDTTLISAHCQILHTGWLSRREPPASPEPRPATSVQCFSEIVR